MRLHVTQASFLASIYNFTITLNLSLTSGSNAWLTSIGLCLYKQFLELLGIPAWHVNKDKIHCSFYDELDPIVTSRDLLTESQVLVSSLSYSGSLVMPWNTTLANHKKICKQWRERARWKNKPRQYSLYFSFPQYKLTKTIIWSSIEWKCHLYLPNITWRRWSWFSTSSLMVDPRRSWIRPLPTFHSRDSRESQMSTNVTS